MAFPLFLALPLFGNARAPADPAAALVHAEALARRTVVATPIPEGLAPRPGEAMADYAARAEGTLVPVAEGLARRDRPLLIAPRSVYNALALQVLPILGPLGRAYGAMANTRVETLRQTGMIDPLKEPTTMMERGGFLIAAMPDADKRTVAAVMGDALGEGGLRPDDRLLSVDNPLLTVTLPNGASFLMTIPSDGKPYDAAPILARYRPVDPDPVPDALRKAVGDRTLPTPGAPLTLAEWARHLAPLLPVARQGGGAGGGGESQKLAVDARAADWRVAVGSPGTTVRTVDALRAVARAERLYWRPLGTGWILAASPGDPRPFAVALLHKEAMEAAFPMFERLARAGRVPKDLLLLLVAGERRTGDLDPDEAAALGRLVAVGKPFTGDQGASARFFGNPNFSGATVKAGFSMNIELVRDGSTMGYGVSLP